MKCPNCDAPERIRVKYCSACGHAYANEDLLELRQLEYLLGETDDWDGTTSYRIPYQEQLDLLKKRILPESTQDLQPERQQPQKPEPQPEAEIKPAPVIAAAVVTETAQVSKVVPAMPAQKQVPPEEKVPFDQWLLSERNIKIALYSGAILLVLAGIIFIGVNWTRFSGGLKFTITSLVTALTYFGGYLLFKRPALRLGGNALFAIAGGFFALNFGVLQIYVLGPQGLPDDVMWLITSPLCLALYIFTAYWTKSDLFSYFSMVAVGSTLAAALVVASAPVLVFFLAFSLLVTCFWGLALWLQKSTVAAFTVTPLRWVSQISMPVILLFAFAGWISETGCTECSGGNPFIAIAAIVMAGLFYIFTDLTTGRREPRWIIPVIFTAALAFSMIELEFSDTNTGIALMLQALAYLWIGYWLDQKESEKVKNATFYIVSFLVALYLTYSTFIQAHDVTTLVIVLFGDVLLLGCLSYIKRNHVWLYMAIWLMILPVYLWSGELIKETYNQAWAMFGLGVIYLGTGYLVARKNLTWGGAFLSAAAVLSGISVAMTFGNLLFASIMLAAWFVLYLLASTWLKWPWLIVPGLVAANLAIATLNIEFVPGSSRPDVLTLSYLGLGMLCWLVGRRMSHIQERDWSWPPYTLGGVDIAGAYLASLWLGGWMAIGVSLTLAALFLVYTSFKPTKIFEKIIFPILPYLGGAILFVSQFFVIEKLQLVEFWPAITAGVCGVFAAIAWLLKWRKAASLYEMPFRVEGLLLMIIPLLGIIMDYSAWVAALAFIICGAVYLVDAGLRRLQLMAFPGIVVLFIAQFFILDAVWNGAWDYWAIVAMPVCALFAVISWLLRGRKLAQVFELPFRLTGLGLMIFPLAGTLIFYVPWVTSLVFAICGAVYLVDAGLRRLQWMAFPGVGIIFASHFFMREAIWPDGDKFWYPIAAVVCVLFATMALLIRDRKQQPIYHLPFRLGGLALMLVPLSGVLIDAIFSDDFLTYALTFGIAGIMYLGDAILRDVPVLGYLGIFNFVAGVWAVLSEYNIHEHQAYVFPLGLVLLGIGWYERRRYKTRFYRLFTMLGCILMLGTAFYQSLPRGAWEYAVLVGFESIVAIFWGIRSQSRGYVQVGGIVLIANALVQFIPSFLEWSRWMQIGLTGSILLGLGLLALFKREKLLETREKITQEWRSWTP